MNPVIFLLIRLFAPALIELLLAFANRINKSVPQVPAYVNNAKNIVRRIEVLHPDWTGEQKRAEAKLWLQTNAGGGIGLSESEINATIELAVVHMNANR